MEFYEKIEDKLAELRVTTSLLSLVQTAFGEGSEAVNMQEASDVLFDIYVRQRGILAEIDGIISTVMKEETNGL